MNVTISPNQCLSITEDVTISTKDSYSSRTRRLTDSELVIDFNELVPSTMTLNECDCVPCEIDEKELHRGFSLNGHSQQGNVNHQASKKIEDDCTATTTAPTQKETETMLDDSTLATVASSISFVNQPRSTKRVRFGSLTIHEHPIVLGGSGVPGVGPAISLGLRGDSHVTVDSVEDYEDARPCLPRKGIEMLLPKRQRVDMLLASGYTFNQIRVASEECEALRKQRARTIQRLSLKDMAKSSLKKMVVWRKSE